MKTASEMLPTNVECKLSIAVFKNTADDISVVVKCEMFRQAKPWGIYFGDGSTLSESVRNLAHQLESGGY